MTHVIPPGQEALLESALRPRGPAAASFALEGLEVKKHGALAHYAHDGRLITLRLVHESEHAVGPQLAVSTFRLVLANADDAPACSRLMASLHTSLTAVAERFVWRTADESTSSRSGDAVGEASGDRVEDTELLAVEAGLKPALRMSVAEDEILAVTHFFESRGLVVRRRHRFDDHDGVESDVLCVSPDASRAEELSALERALHDGAGGPLHVDADNARLIGELLGYPACCVRAHEGRVRAPVEGRAATYEAARQAWVRRPHHRLNHVIAGHVRPLIPFEPCTFRCEVALSYADAVASLLGDRDPPSLASLEASLARAVVVHPSGARGFAELDGQRVVSVETLARKHGYTPEKRDRDALSQGVGEPGPDGVLADGSLFIDFRMMTVIE